MLGTPPPGDWALGRKVRRRHSPEVKHVRLTQGPREFLLFAFGSLIGTCSFINVINWLNDGIAVYMHDLPDAPRARLARGPKAAHAPHHGKLLMAAVVAVAALAAVGMSETAMAQTNEIKIGILSASPPEYEVGPIQAMELARDAWNADAIPGIDTELKLKVVDIRGDPQSQGYPGFLAQQIGAAVQDGYKHFVAPSDDVSLLFVHNIVRATPGLSNTILVSPASQATFDPSLFADDNLFRLAPNAATQSLRLLDAFDRQGADRVVIVTDAALVSLVNPSSFPDDVHDHYILPPVPIFGPGDTVQNVQSLTDLNDRLAALIDQHGKERVAVLAATTQYAFVTMAHVLAANPQLDAIDDVQWFGYNHLGHSFVITGDPVAAAFADEVDMSVIEYVVAPNEINAPLSSLPAFSPGFRNYNFASYDAIHLLADAIAIGGVDSSTLKDVVLDVANNNVHAVPHTDRILGLGAIGDYMLDPATGDLVESRSYVAYHVVQSGDGYVWEELAPPRTCR